MKRLFLKIVVPFSIAFFFFASTQSYADTIVLKNGNKIEVEKAYDQGDSIKGVKPYGSVSFPKSSVETVIYEKKPNMIHLNLMCGNQGSL